MTSIVARPTAPCCAITLLVAAFAQEPVIIVDIKDIANQVAERIDADPDLLPLTVQAPLHVAAKVCGVPETILGMEGSSSGAAGCAANTSSPELEEILQSKLRDEPPRQ